ncbi:MAG: T9SS type A sorting domain-containing protein [Chitinophagales bacterium]|nr:T9SS type A sorting domain-containing protein [Chitinophagales bacterium]
MKHTLLLPLLLLVTVPAFSQNEWCGTMRNVEKQISQNPNLAVDFDKMLDRLRDMSMEENNRGTNAEVITIPVVFHIVHNGDAVGADENISDAKVQSQIDAMNKHFNAQDAGLPNVPSVFQPLIANCEIRFCLAKFDPQGNPTSGIIRHQYSNATWDSDNDVDDVLKPATIWDRNKYLNIWSIKMGGDLSSSGILAYATFPLFGPANKDGVVARYNTIGTISPVMAQYNLGKTVTHEVGHWLGLLHTWGTAAGCGGQGDYIADTPDQYDANYGCPTFPSVSCSSSAPNGDMFMNYMDYTLDACHTMFTLGQNDRMRSILNGTRSSIKTAANTACYYSLDASVLSIKFPSDTICASNFKPIITIRNEGVVAITSGKFYFQVDGDVVQIMNWNGNIPSQTELDITLPEQISIAGMHTFDVTFGNVNGQSADNFPANDSKAKTFYITAGSNGAAVPATEGFENAFPAANWSVQNPNNDATWEKNSGFGAYGSSSSCVSIDNLSYGTNPGKRRDAIITDSYDLSFVTYPELTFDVAYAPYNASRFDSLIVYYSLNCGKTWTRIWEQKGEQLATAPAQTVLFTPAPSQWKTVSVPVLAPAGQNKVSFKFENVCGWGNALYLDNINLQNNISLGVNQSAKVDVAVFPNPASDMAAVRLPVMHPFQSLTVYNNLGEVVLQYPLTGSSAIFSTVDFPKGIYFIHLQGTGASQTEKLLIVK